MRRFLWLCIALLASSATISAVESGKLNPCREQRPSVKAGGVFSVAFAFLPTGEDSTLEWGTREDGLHPCSLSQRQALAGSAVAVSYFNVEVDKLTLLDSTDQLQQLHSSTLDNVTVIAFSGGYRSEPKVVSVRDGDDWKIIRSLALIAKFSENGLEQFQWSDLECGECEREDSCVEFEGQKSCAFLCESANRASCRSEIYVSFDGIDKNNEVLNSASQIRRLRRASVSHIYSSGRDIATSAVEQF